MRRSRRHPRWLLTAGLVLCGVSVSAQHDRILVHPGSHGPVVGSIVYISGHRMGGPFCEFHAGVDLPIRNVTAGRSQVAVLSETHGVRFEPSVSWQYLYNERLTLAVPVRADLPVRVWTMVSLPRDPVAELSTAQRALNGALAGVNVRASVSDERHRREFNLSCGDRSRLESAGLFEADAVNVYYAECLDGQPGEGICVTSPGGWTCPDRRMAFVFGPSSPTTLAHELAHALLGPEHWGIPGDDNLLATSARRATLSTGQAIGLNYDAHSVLNVLRQQSGLDCAVDCPSYALEIGRSCPLWIGSVPGAGGAAGVQPPVDSSLSPPVRAVLEWFECVECVDQELSRVVETTPAATVLDVLALPLRDPTGVTDPFGALLGFAEIYGVPGESVPSRLNRWQRRGVLGLGSLAERGDPDIRPQTVKILLGLDASKLAPSVGAEVLRLQNRYRQ